MTERTIVWKGREIRTIGDVTDALAALESREEAQEFMRLYHSVNVHAYQNVGYCAGYLDNGTAQRIYDWCGTSHPIFGRAPPSAEEAFELGKRWATEDGQ